MRNIDINGLSFIQTHDEDSVRFDVRDADFRRVAYVEYDGSRVLCTTKGGKIIYETETNIKNPDMWLGHCADEINAHLEEKRARKISSITTNNKIKAVWQDNKLFFNHFVVKKDSDNFFGVYYRDTSALVTSATTLKGATKKAKLLEVGYKIGSDSAYDFHREMCRHCSF